jgi:predicted ATPase/DNA-binding winged helix-turn-helix (wHTH) protein
LIRGAEVPAEARFVYEAGTLEIDPGRRELRARGVTVPIGGRAFEIIEALVESAGQLVTKDDLMGRVWPGAIVEENTLQVHISAIRKALGPDRAVLKTASGRGYRLLGRWTARQQDASADPVDVAPARVPAQPAKSNLPTAASDLIGRATAVQHLRDLMSAYRVVTLTGPGGIGKTRLALEIARILSPGFEDDAWLVELASLSDASLVAAAIASVLGLHLGVNDISPESLARAIGSRKLLLVIDNCEHVIDAAAKVVETLIRLCPAASVLATSRELMRIEGECTYRVPPLEFPVQERFDADRNHVMDSSAVQLFIARSEARAYGLQHRDELSDIAAICRRLDGIPLAIEFAAARAATFGVGEVLSRLDDRFAVLTSGGRRTALPKHRTLRATLDWSYELLSEAERLLLQRLAIFAGAFSLEAARAVTRSSAAPPTDIADGVADLVAKSLVTADIAGAVMHFRLLETTRVYGLEKLTESGTSQHFARRHADYYRELLEKIADERETSPVHLADLGNVRAALEWCFGVDGDAAVGVGLAAAATPVFLAMSMITECHRWSERALFTLDDATRGGREEMHLQASLGMSLMFTRGEGEAVRAALNRSLQIAEDRGDAATQLKLLGPLRMFHSRIGDFRTALDYAQRGTVVARTIADPAATALVHSMLGMSLSLAGDLGGARAELEAALQHGPGSPRTNTILFGFDGYNMAAVTLAMILWLQGYPTQAAERARQSVAATALLNHPVTFSVALVWAIFVLLGIGDLRCAEQYIDWFISNAESHSLGPYLAVGLGFKGQLAICRGDAKDGIEKLRRCLEELHAVRYELLTTPFEISLAQGLGAIERPAEGIALIKAGIRRVEVNGDLCYMPELLRVKGVLLLALPEPAGDDAETVFMQSLELSRVQSARAWELRAAIDLAALWAARGRRENARALLQPVFEQFVEGSDTADVKAAEELLATLGYAKYRNV